ncbi:PadR family transcriptional regulator [Priestia taiwanensis]|uniref:PadR family transcriptional regulator n=1 Tax=Priestia taiwanensis TaxID=1347902 RepID=A0A917AKD6_9BACI|nr:PadR family transcriptional regulator [Priestia taiwanensis]MBM7361844.1 DNA-binding PadR family transcriptional regulator [Priestia taiwanensis]GGE57366.1 PadR family transcriptional regulator [Priestia taiwanensis]
MTRTMVLGLLTMGGAMSGYEMQQMMNLSQTDKWANVQPASIYHALKKLTAEEFVSLDSIEQTGNRSKAIYSITKQGKKEFERLLVESFKQPSVVFPTGLYTALTFIDNVQTEEVLHALDIQEKAINELYADMKAGEQEKAKYISIPPHVMLIFNNMYDQCELQLKFIQQIREEISNRKDE